jgi:hypothetical protein
MDPLSNHRVFIHMSVTKCPTCPQCPCLASYAMMCGVEGGRSGTLGCRDAWLIDARCFDVLLVGCLWLHVVVLVGTVVLREQRSLEIVSSERCPFTRLKMVGFSLHNIPQPSQPSLSSLLHSSTHASTGYRDTWDTAKRGIIARWRGKDGIDATWSLAS